MSTIEERLQALEQDHQTLEQGHQTLEREHAELRKTIELQTIAIGALVNKAALEKLNEKYDRMFETLISHDRLTNEQLAEVRTQHIEMDGKLVGLRTEMRQRFDEQGSKIVEVGSKIVEVDGRVTGLQIEMGQGFAEQGSKIVELQAVQGEQTKLLQQILARLPEQN